VRTAITRAARAVSSFGFGGSNFHVAIEEYTGPGEAADRTRARRELVVVVTGGSAADVARSAARSRVRCEACTDAGPLMFLPQRAAGVRRRASQHGARVAVVAKSEAELVQKLRQLAAELADKGVASDRSGGVSFGLGVHEGGVALLFPGQGSQYLEMGARSRCPFEEVRSAWDHAASLALAATSCTTWSSRARSSPPTSRSARRTS
jgi:acyl transferase domain-containing protein